jgi:hypothetical protein
MSWHYVSIPVIAVLLAAGPAPAAELPDLEQSAPDKLRVERREGGWYLGFATAVHNVGAGALRIRGSGAGDGSMTAQQLSEDGVNVLNPRVGSLRYVTTFGHRHWHFMGFMRYELRGMDVAGVLRDRKQGFCLGDAPFVDGWCARDKPALISTDIGIRPGGVDIYEPNVEGQELRIDRMATPSGRYVLTSRIGPTGVIQETRRENNVASTVFELRWPLRDGQVLVPFRSCAGEGCAGALPRVRAPRRMTRARAQRLARLALHRTIGPLPPRVRLDCRASRPRGHGCRVWAERGRSRFSGRVRVWYVRDGAATRWRYTVDLARRVRGCRGEQRCVRRIRRVDLPGGTEAARSRAWGAAASTSSFVCPIAK